MMDILKITQDGPNKRYVTMAEHLYSTLMPAIRKKMIHDGYEYYNVEALDDCGHFYKYLYVKRDIQPKPLELYLVGVRFI